MMCGCLNMSVTSVEQRVEKILAYCQLLICRNAILRLGRGNVKHAGLGSPAADTCKPHEVPGRPCALTGLTGIFTLSVHPQTKKWVSQSTSKCSL